MFHFPTRLVRHAAFASLCALCIATLAVAQTSAPAPGRDRAPPAEHVYMTAFKANDGARYIQIHKLNGTLLAVLPAVPGTSVVLPMEVEAQDMAAVQPGTPTASARAMPSAAQTVYRDNDIGVKAIPQSDGTTRFIVLMCAGASCSGSIDQEQK